MIRSTSILPRVQWSLSTMLVSVVCAQAALAGPDFDEGPDAGGLPPTSKALASSTSTEVRRVSGSTSVAALTGDGDRVDMFLVRTGANTAAFKWIGPTWGARLTLFKKETATCASSNLSVTVGRPICTVAKASVAQDFPVLNGAAPVIDRTGMPLGLLSTYLTPNSDYYIAISGVTNRPLCDNNPCSSATADDADVFDFATGTGQFLASENIRATYRIARWLDPDGEASGSYSMEITETFTVPGSTCREVMAVVGGPVEKVFDFNFAPAAPTGTAAVSCAPTFTVARQFFYTWSPQCSGLAEVTTCGFTAADSAIEVFEVDACTRDTCAAAATSPIACNDQCGTGNSSRVTFTAAAGSTYLVRLTRLVSAGAQTGTIKFTCTPTPPSADLNGDGTVDGADLAVLFGRWGTSGN